MGLAAQSQAKAASRRFFVKHGRVYGQALWGTFGCAVPAIGLLTRTVLPTLIRAEPVLST